MSTLLESHNAHIEKIKAAGKPVLSNLVPCCNREIETPAPDAGDEWDTLATCPHCNELHMKVVTSTTVTATRI